MQLRNRQPHLAASRTLQKGPVAVLLTTQRIAGRPACLLLLIILLVTPVALFATIELDPLPYDEGSLGLAFALRKLPVSGSFLYAAAHPDDEDNPLLVLLGRGRGLRTGLLTLTRGDGGQNEIGPELFESLGIIRTGELMAMHRYDGAQQFFSRAYEFGYSFSVEETFSRWGKEEILADTVRIIRMFRPQVIVTLPRFGAGGGQHHQASALIVEEAFRAAADPNRFPEQIRQGLLPWQAKKLYERSRRRGQEQQQATVSMQTGHFDPLFGKTYYEIGLEERSFHKSQGMGQLVPLPTERDSSWSIVDSTLSVKPHEEDLMDGVDTSLFLITEYVQGEEQKVPFLRPALEDLLELIRDTLDSFEMRHPEKTARPLAEGLALVRRLRTQIGDSALSVLARHEVLFLLEAKENDFKRALGLARQVSLQAVVDDGLVVPGQELGLRVNVANGGPHPLGLDQVLIKIPEGWQISSSRATPSSVGATSAIDLEYRIRVAEDANISQPYWFRSDPRIDRFQLRTPEDFGKPWSDPIIQVTAHHRFDGVTADLTASAQFRYPGPWVGGEQRHNLMVVPEFSVELKPDLRILPLSRIETGFSVQVKITFNGHSSGKARLHFSLPHGWKADPESSDVSFHREGQSRSILVHVQPPFELRPGDSQVSVHAESKGRRFNLGHQFIDYDHIQKRVEYRPSRMTVRALDVELTPELKVGYIEGVGDHVPQALGQLGVSFTYLSEDDLAFGDLGTYDVILTGVRAYLVREDLKAYNDRLLDWVHSGGVLIVQYNKFEFNGPPIKQQPGTMSDSPYAPFPVQVSQGRVTDESAPILLLEPQHPVFLRPNLISERDWQNWVQERGLYFLGRKDERYRDLVSTADSFENNPGEKLGSLVEADYGQGRWIYIGLGLWRQLPSGVPGAYRLLANLLSLPASR